jgi:hypothetical protein
MKRLIENIPTSKIHSIAMGLVEIKGRVIPVDDRVLLKSPFSNKDCVYHKYLIETDMGIKDENWVTIGFGENHQLFYLKDTTGSVLVNPKDAKIDIPKDNEFGKGAGKMLPREGKDFILNEKKNFEKEYGFIMANRYTEWYIAPDDILYVLGTAKDNPYLKEGTAEKSASDIMIHKGKYDKIYYISDKKEKDILSRFRWKTYGIVLGSILISIGLGGLITLII